MRGLLALVAAGMAAVGLAGPADRPLPPREAPLRMTLPEGFQATLFAGEPDVVQPIAFTFDDRGRLWVVECLSYPQWTDKPEGKDRVVIFEDTDGDGHFDKRTVFWDKGANLSGIALGFGGVWLCSTPNLIFLPMRAGEDKPAGPPKVLLDGWSLQAKHNVFNSLEWGPDGWLYGCNGILATSYVGKPGTPQDQRTPFNCGVWRYHPTRERFEVVAWGTTNPWGLDWDEYGQAFITNCVIHHLWHVVPGAHFQRMYGQDLNPNVYGLIGSVADHIHWGGGDWTSSRGGQGAHSTAGGGHAHSGAMIYLGDNWPQRYRGGVFTCNIHGNRVNHDLLERKGSSYVARHGKDFLLANDPWFRGIALKYGPDGGVYVADWCDTGECHNYTEVDRTNGRIYKVTHGKPKVWKGDLAKCSDAELVEFQKHENEWFARHARRLLQERAGKGTLAGGTRTALVQLAEKATEVPLKLRALWCLHVIGGLTEAELLALLDSSEEVILGWAIQLALEAPDVPAAIEQALASLASRVHSNRVQVQLASGMQRLPPARRWAVLEALAREPLDIDEAYFDHMVWYALEPLAAADPARAAALLGKDTLFMVNEYLARRLVSLPGDQGAQGLERVLSRLLEPGLRQCVQETLRGVAAGLKGLKQVPMPPSWEKLYPRLLAEKFPETPGFPGVRDLATGLAVQFGDKRALAVLRRTVTDSTAATPARTAALLTLVTNQGADLPPLLQGLLADPALRSAALRGLAVVPDDATPAAILRHYPSLTSAEKADALQTLASRPAFARALLDALEKGALDRRDLSAFTVRQLLNLKDPALSDRLTRLYGVIRPAAQDYPEKLAKYKKLLTPDTLKAANLANGRRIFANTCGKCHALFGEGGGLGPDLTGSQRANLDYLLENVLDPSAVVPREYQVSVFSLKNGRTINGIVKEEGPKTLVIQTLNETITVAKDDIEDRAQTKQSIMPDGLLDPLSKEEVRDLVGYLASPVQVR